MKASTTWKHFQLLMWKNLMYRIRDWTGLISQELLLPTGLFLGITLYMQYKGVFSGDMDATNRKIHKIDLRKLYSNFDLSTKLCYYPTVDFTKEIMKKVQSKLKLKPENVLNFRNKSSFLNYFTKTHENNSIFAIAFQNHNGSAIPPDFVYFIKPYIKAINRSKATLVDNRGSRKYIKTSLLSLQIALETSFVESSTNNSLAFHMEVRKFANSQLENMIEAMILTNVLPMLIIASYYGTIGACIAKPTTEKGTGIKELMKSSGINSWLIYLGWIIQYLSVSIISDLIITIILTVPIWKADKAVLTNSSFSFLAVFLIIFSLSLITYSLFVASFFDSEIPAALAGLVIWALVGTYKIKENASKSVRMLLGLFPPYTVGFICQQMGIYCSKNTEVNWSNIGKSADGDINAVTISNGLSLLCLSSIVFTVLSLYTEQIFPGRYGASKPWYFFIYYISDCWNAILQPNRVESETSFVADSDTTEPPTPNLKPGICIKQLCKKFGRFTAVDNLSFDIYEGLITVLLGQNGAGKTTLMSIITGMMTATSGKISISGKDTRYNMDLIRSSLGYCPQNNINFDALNVEDHFLFFGMLKGLNKPEARSQTMSVLNELNLYEQRKKKAKQLSGGMQRRLSLGIALMGNSKVLILDEPTSGLDPETRRELWDILLKLKKSRTIIITTHFMEEADALADRIVIINHGNLTCYGTPMFLKKLYGSGYHLTLIRDKALFEQTYPAGNQIEAITKLVKGKLKEATLFDSNFNCLTYVLPYDKKSQFGSILSEIENTKEALCVTHISLSITTLEEVFLKAGSVKLKENQELKSTLRCSVLPDNDKLKSITWQLSSLLQKRWRILKRRALTYVIPGLIAIIICGSIVHLTYKADMAKITKPKSFINYGRTIYYSFTNNKTDYFTKMKKRYAAPIEEPNTATHNIDKFDKVDNIDKLTVAEKLNDAVHSVHLLGNSILEVLKNKNYSIASTISSLREDKFSFKSESDLEEGDIMLTMYWIVIFPTGLLFLVLPVMILPQKETISNLKQLQLMCGVSPLLYWGAFYILDLLFYLICVLIIATILLIYQFYGLLLYDHISFCFMLMEILVVYGISAIPYTYLFSNAKAIYNAVALDFQLSYFVPLIFFALEKKGMVPSWATYIFALFPQYGLTIAMSLFYSKGSKMNTLKATFTPELCKKEKHPCCDQGSTKACNEAINARLNQGNTFMYILLAMIASSFLYFAILIILEEQFILNLFEKIRLMLYTEKKTSKSDYANREDVKRLEEKISGIMDRELNQGDAIRAEDSKSVLIAHNLEKSYKGLKVVKKISFNVDVGEYFGLLGVNGAGKTTTFRMLTGNLPIMMGECRIVTASGQKFYLSKSPNEYFTNIGYCPQYDVTDETLTGYEMLELFGKLRGISEGLDEEIKIYAKCLGAYPELCSTALVGLNIYTTDRLFDLEYYSTCICSTTHVALFDGALSFSVLNVGFDEIVNRACAKYSGGNKRKLNIAMALIGVPSVILLDEPTSGVDPISRRAMWNMLKLMQAQKVKPAMVLTTHSMEECEVLCNKIAIMKAGEFQCYGTIPQLKTKYPQGFTVTLKLLADNNVEQQLAKVQNLKLKFQQMYKGFYQLKDEYSSLLQYHIGNVNLKWSDVFKDIEQLQKDFSIIEDYTITETTLEEVFIAIARSE